MAAEAVPFYTEPEFWVAIAFVIVVGAAFKPVFRLIVTALDDRAATIRNRIAEAARLREEAQELLASFQRRQRDAVKEAEDIVERARQEADRMAERTAEDLKRDLERREKTALERIAQAEAKAIDEVRATAADLILDATHRLLAKKIKGKKAAALVDAAIEELPKKLH